MQVTPMLRPKKCSPADPDAEVQCGRQCASSLYHVIKCYNLETSIAGRRQFLPSATHSWEMEVPKLQE